MAAIGNHLAPWNVAPNGLAAGASRFPAGTPPDFSTAMTPETPANRAQWRMVDSLPRYPGQDVTQASIQVSERMGPTILVEFLLPGRDLETHVRTVMAMWKGESKSFSPFAHAEAVNIPRVLHILILESHCPKVELRASLVPEVLLRRLWCLLEVERQVAQTGITRARAWQSVEPVLEHRPEAYSPGTAMSKFISERFNAISKFESNLAKKPPAPKS